MAPGASLIGMKVFGDGAAAFASVIIQGMDWAVTHDHADVLSESFGGYPMPDTARDIDQAVQRRGRAPPASPCRRARATPARRRARRRRPPTRSCSTPAANTNFRAYAQTDVVRVPVPNGTWLSDNISSIGGGGFGQDAVVAGLRRAR